MILHISSLSSWRHNSSRIGRDALSSLSFTLGRFGWQVKTVFKTQFLIHAAWTFLSKVLHFVENCTMPINFDGICSQSLKRFYPFMVGSRQPSCLILHYHMYHQYGLCWIFLDLFFSLIIWNLEAGHINTPNCLRNPPPSYEAQSYCDVAFIDYLTVCLKIHLDNVNERHILDHICSTYDLPSHMNATSNIWQCIKGSINPACLGTLKPQHRLV